MKKSIFITFYTFFLISNSFAEIIYTNVNPNFTTTLDPLTTALTDAYPIDFNNDGNKEFDIRWDDYSLLGYGWFLHLTYSSIGNNMLLTGNTNLYNAGYLKVINQGEEIGNILSSGQWGTTNPEPLIGDNTNPNFQNLGDKYIGVSIEINGDTHYGWILISFDENKMLTLKGFAYEDVAYTSINAGDTLTPVINVESIDVFSQNGNSAINFNENIQMGANISPSNASNQEIIWSIDPISASATVSTNGLVYGQQSGSTGIVHVIATSFQNSAIADTFELTILHVPVTSIEVLSENGNYFVQQTQTLQMTANISPNDATIQTVSWSVENITGEASIQFDTGILTGISDGTVKVIANSSDGTGIVGDTIINIESIEVDSISVGVLGGTTTVEINLSLQMIADIYPFNANQNVTWSIINGTGTGEIYSNGTFFALSTGTVTVVATSTSFPNISDSIVINIVPVSITSLTIEGENGATTVGTTQTLQMISNIIPYNATNQYLVWSITNGTGSATINLNGMVTGQTIGTVTITANTTDFTNISASTILNVTGPQIAANSITVEGYNGETSVFINQDLQMMANILPENATNQDVIWSVMDNTGSANIDSNGVLTALSLGNVTVYATHSQNNTIIGSAIVTILQNITSIQIEGENGDNNVNETQTLQINATILPANANNQNVVWTIINGTGSASISTEGVITGESVGSVRVIATAEDGYGTSDTLVINVIELIIYITEIEVNGENNQTSVPVNGYLQMIANVIPTNASSIDFEWWVVNESGSAIIDSNGLLSPTNIGTVSVKAVAQDGSNTVGEKQINITNATKINESIKNTTLIFPNPSSDFINVLSKKKFTSMILYSIDGKIVLNKKYQDKISLIDISKGNYILKLIDENSFVEVHRVIKK